MAVTNYERVGKAMELLRQGLVRFVDREMTLPGPDLALRKKHLRSIAREARLADKPLSEWDVAGLLRLMAESWFEVLAATLGYAEQALVIELRGARNDWADQRPLSSDDADRLPRRFTLDRRTISPLTSWTSSPWVAQSHSRVQARA